MELLNKQRIKFRLHISTKNKLKTQLEYSELQDKGYSLNYLWIAKSSASAATVFSPPDKLSMGRNRLPGATQL